MNDRQRNPRLVALAVLGFALFNYPLLAVFDAEVIVLGVPLIWLYLFTVWGGLIVAVALSVRER